MKKRLVQALLLSAMMVSLSAYSAAPCGAKETIRKNTETVNKTAPDKIVVFNYKEKEIYEVNPNNQIEEGNISNTDKSIKIDNIRIAIGWQNGNGLNNPTIRVFLRR